METARPEEPYTNTALQGFFPLAWEDIPHTCTSAEQTLEELGEPGSHEQRGRIQMGQEGRLEHTVCQDRRLKYTVCQVRARVIGMDQVHLCILTDEWVDTTEKQPHV